MTIRRKSSSRDQVRRIGGYEDSGTLTEANFESRSFIGSKTDGYKEVRSNMDLNTR